MKVLTIKDVSMVSGAAPYSEKERKDCDVYRKDKGEVVLVGRFYIPISIFPDHYADIMKKNATSIRAGRTKTEYFVECPDSVAHRSLDDDLP